MSSPTFLCPPDQGKSAFSITPGPPVRGAGDSIWMAEVGANRRWLQFDTKYQEFTTFPVPAGFTGPITGNSMRVDPNGKMVWSTTRNRIVGLNIQTKQFVAYDMPHWVETKKNPGGYGIDVAGDGGVWFAEREANKIGRLDPATGKIDEYPTPGKDIPRRMGADWEGNIWIGFHETGKLVKIDHKTGKMTFYDAADPEQWRLPRGRRSEEQGDLGDPADVGQDRPLRSQDGNVDGVLAADRGVGCETDRNRSVQPEPHLVVGRHLEPSRLHRGARINRTLDAQWRTAGSR